MSYFWHCIDTNKLCIFFFHLHGSIYEMKMLSMSQEGVLAKEF